MERKKLELEAIEEFRREEWRRPQYYSGELEKEVQRSERIMEECLQTPYLNGQTPEEQQTRIWIAIRLRKRFLHSRLMSRRELVRIARQGMLPWLETIAHLKTEKELLLALHTSQSSFTNMQ